MYFYQIEIPKVVQQEFDLKDKNFNKLFFSYLVFYQIEHMLYIILYIRIDK